MAIVRDLRRDGRAVLSEAAIVADTNVIALEVDVLLAAALKLSSSQIAIRLDQQLSSKEQAEFEGYLRRRSGAEPIAYILGSKEFYSREFLVNPEVLIPRPETEMLVDRVLRHLNPEVSAFRVVEVGTGSGCVAVSIAAELRDKFPEAFLDCGEIIAVDCSSEALAVARANAEKHGVAERIKFLQSDLLAEVLSESPEGVLQLVVSNPPYVPEGDLLAADVVDYEPMLALRSGEAGMDCIERLVAQWHEGWASGLFLLEFGDGQVHALEYLLSSLGIKNFEFFKDLQGISRVLEVRK